MLFQNYKVVFYPNVQQQYQYPQPGTQGAENWWVQNHLDTVFVGGLSLAMIVAGGLIVYPRFVTAKARAMRGLSEMKSEDASRMARGILNAIEKIYEMNKGTGQTD